MHELSHFIMCKICDVKVTDYKLFGFDKNDDGVIGYVSHIPINIDSNENILISAAPVYICTPIGVILYYISIIYTNNIVLSALCLFLGVSILFHAVPSVGIWNP